MVIASTIVSRQIAFLVVFAKVILPLLDFLANLVFLSLRILRDKKTNQFQHFFDY